MACIQICLSFGLCTFNSNISGSVGLDDIRYIPLESWPAFSLTSSFCNDTTPAWKRSLVTHRPPSKPAAATHLIVRSEEGVLVRVLLQEEQHVGEHYHQHDLHLAPALHQHRHPLEFQRPVALEDVGFLEFLPSVHRVRLGVDPDSKKGNSLHTTTT